MHNNIKNILGITVIVAMVVLAYSAWQVSGSYLDSVSNNSSRSFSVSAQESVVAVPDIARFSFSVITEGGKNLTALQEENTQKANAAIAFLKKNGVDAKDVKTESYQIYPRYTTFQYLEQSGKTPPSEISGYTVSQNISVKVRDLAKAGELLAGVIENGANSVSQLVFEVDDVDALQNEARGKAIASAREKAETLAREGGFKLGRLLNISEGGLIPYGGYDYGRGGISTLEAQPVVEPGSQEITATVTLLYEIK